MKIQSTTTGSRIRERRLQLKIKQTDLANRVGISASYLNLIEHNQRNIAGRLLLDIAREMDVDAIILSDGSRGPEIDALNSAARNIQGHAAETEQTEEFARNYPGWASLTLAQNNRIQKLNKSLETLHDRISHDPHLAASLHDVVSTVTAIRASAAILVESPDIETEWRDRFQRNVFEESKRLVDSSQQLVNFLEESSKPERTELAPREEFQAFLGENKYHFHELETGQLGPKDLVSSIDRLTLTSSRKFALEYLEAYLNDARAMPLDDFAQSAIAHNFDPAKLAHEFSAPMPAVFRRLASLPLNTTSREIGLVICDNSGALTFSKPINGFEAQTFSNACSLWPIFQTLGRPLMPIRKIIEVPGRTQKRFVTFSISESSHPWGFGGPAIAHGYMLVLDMEEQALQEDSFPVGLSCAICPRQECPARRGLV